MLISNEQVLLFLYEKLFPYQNQRPQSVRTTIDVQKVRPASSQPSLTTAQSYVPPHLLNNNPSSRFVMEDGTSLASPNKMDRRFLPHQPRAKTSQSNQRNNSNNKWSSMNEYNILKSGPMPYPFEGSTSSLLEANRFRHGENTNYFNNRRIIKATEGIKGILNQHHQSNIFEFYR